MKILAIETSCDDTGVTVLEAKGGLKKPRFKILADNLASQTIHNEYGGVYPMLAKREHIKSLPILLEKTLREAEIPHPQTPLLAKERGAPRISRSGVRSKPIDLIAVTYGPGLPPALWAGINFAQELARKWQVPVMPVNHMEGHIFSVFADGKQFSIPNFEFPILSLLVSGGHTELVLVKGFGKYKIIGETLDDAVGEAFDKVARMLGLPYPGGPHISRLAEAARKSPQGRTLGIQKGPTFSRFSLPRPMLKSKDFNFSYAGLKTAVLYLIRKLPKLDEKTKAQIALEFENAAIEPLVYKTALAVQKFNIKTLWLGGGVAANKHLRKMLKVKIQKSKVKVLFPTKELARDNSVMIGMVGYLNYLSKKKFPRLEEIKAIGNLKL